MLVFEEQFVNSLKNKLHLKKIKGLNNLSSDVGSDDAVYLSYKYKGFDVGLEINKMKNITRDQK